MASDLSAELEQWRTRLAEQSAALSESGLHEDEAFLIALRRRSSHDGRARAFLENHPDLLWRHATRSPADGFRRSREGLVAMLVFACVAGLVTRGGLEVVDAVISSPSGRASLEASRVVAWYGLSVVALAAVVAGYFLWERRSGEPATRPSRGAVLVVAAFLALAAGVLVLYPFRDPGNTPGLSNTLTLTFLHLLVAGWLVLGVAYLGRAWPRVDPRLDFVRFTGELALYFVLLALGGMVLYGLTMSLFQLAGLDIVMPLIEMLPFFVAAALVVACWLVESRRNTASAIAPVLTAVFIPLALVVVLSFLAAILVSGRLVHLDREILIVFDVFLALVFGLLLFSVCARDPAAPPRLHDYLQVALVVVTLVVDLLVLVGMGGRIAEYGASPNKLAALGENVVLAANLVGTAWLYLGFLRGRRAFTVLVRWQCLYLPVLLVWALVVAMGFPLVFDFR